MKKRGQASLEYLTTYGWAFILIIVMIGAMAWFGVLDPKNWVSDRCNFGPEFGGSCKEHKLSTAEVRFRLKNALPDPQKIKSIAFKTEEGKTLDCTAPADLITFTWPTGEFKDFVFTGCKMGDVGITAGSKEKILVTIVYFSVKGSADYSHEGKGEILSRVQSSTAPAAITGNSCKELFNKGVRTDGIYKINVGGQNIDVYCDMTKDEGGWTLGAVCRANDPKCWNVNSVGTLTSPTQTSSAKLPDSAIKSILGNGDKLTRTSWQQDTMWGGPPGSSSTVYNKITNPSVWSSDIIGVNGNEFFVKFTYSGTWSSPILTTATGCAGASNGWSNTRRDSCSITWYAGCEGGPTMSHCCACSPTTTERANIAVWIR